MIWVVESSRKMKRKVVEYHIKSRNMHLQPSHFSLKKGKFTKDNAMGTVRGIIYLHHTRKTMPSHKWEHELKTMHTSSRQPPKLPCVNGLAC